MAQAGKADDHALVGRPPDDVTLPTAKDDFKPATGRLHAAPLFLAVPLAILVIGCLASYAIYAELLDRARAAWQEVAGNQIERLDRTFVDALRTTQPPLRAITGLFLGSESVERQEFDRAIAALAPNDTDPSDIAIAYLQADENGRYRIPFATGFTRYGPDGLDPGSWPGLSAAVMPSADRPQRLMMSPEPLFNDAIGPRFALFVALKGGAHPPMLVAPLDLEQILATFVATQVPSGLQLSVSHRAMINGTVYPIAYRPLPGDADVHALPGSSGQQPFVLTSRLVFADAEWQLNWTVAPTFQGGANRNLANTVLVGGLCFSLLCAVLFLLARHEIKRERAHAVTAKRAAEMFRRHMIELAQARDAAEQASRAKSQFLANMSHELRTPLNAIIGFADMMKLGIGGRLENEKHLECVKHISDSGTLLFKLIDQLFDTAKIESGQVELVEEPHDAEGLAREAIALVQPAANTKRIRLVMEVAPDLPSWMVDHRAALQILNNLLTNAVKFSGRDTRVVLRLQRLDNGGLGISVVDQGPGIAPETLPRIFERFSRGDATIAGKEEGLGLGLWIVRNLVEMHRGEASVESELGRGTTIHLRFPPPEAPQQPYDPVLIPAD